jgi:hypothetical protein
MAKPKHTVYFTDTASNWLLWGTLVDGWIFNNPPNRPNDVGELQDQMQAAGITGIELAGTPAPVPNAERNRPVNVVPYNTLGGPITISIPHKNMAQIDKTWLASLGNYAYPLPSFYSAMFNGAPPLAVLTPAVLEEMRKRRVGEYVINECM